eukprot:gene13992-biopygen539
MQYGKFALRTLCNTNNLQYEKSNSEQLCNRKLCNTKNMQDRVRCDAVRGRNEPPTGPHQCRTHLAESLIHGCEKTSSFYFRTFRGKKVVEHALVIRREAPGFLRGTLTE